MTDVNASIPLGAVAPDPTAMAGKFMTLANLQNQVQAGQIANTSNAADLAEKQALRGLANDPSVHNPDGSINQAAYQQKAQQVAPTLGAGQSQQSTMAQRQNTQASHEMFNLSQDQQKAGQTALGSMANDPRLSSGDPEQVSSAVSDAVQQAIQGGVPAHVAMSMAAPILVNAHQNPTAVPQQVKGLIAAANGPAGTAAAIQPNYASTGGTLVNTNGYMGQAAPTIQGTLSPMDQHPIVTDKLGNSVALTRSPSGPVTGVSPLPTGGAAQGPQPMMAYPSGESDNTAQTLQNERSAAKAQANAAPQMHANNQGILDALNNVAATGITGAAVAKIESLIGATPGTVKGSTDAEKQASAYDLIGKYAERNALQAASTMGPGTNAGLEAAIKANGSAAYNPTALREVTKLNDSIVTGSEKYSQGLDAAVQNSPNQIYAKRQFDTQWAQNASATTLKFLNAAKTGNTADQQAIIKSVGGPGSKGYQQLVQQMQNLQALTTTGTLPRQAGQ